MAAIVGLLGRQPDVVPVVVLFVCRALELGEHPTVLVDRRRVAEEVVVARQRLVNAGRARVGRGVDVRRREGDLPLSTVEPAS